MLEVVDIQATSRHVGGDEGVILFSRKRLSARSRPPGSGRRLAPRRISAGGQFVRQHAGHLPRVGEYEGVRDRGLATGLRSFNPLPGWERNCIGVSLVWGDFTAKK